MGAKFGVDLKYLLSDEYDPSVASASKFKEQWDTLIKEQERLREMLKDRNRELQVLGQLITD